MSNDHEYKHMVEYYYGGGFIHKTLSIPRSYPCTSCHSWFQVLVTQLKDFKHKAELEMKVRIVMYVICTLQFVFFFLNEWTDGFKGKFKK